MIGFPLPTVIAVLERGCPSFGDAAFNVTFAYDHEEAAGFVAADWERITADWHGTAHELRFLRGFVRAFSKGGS